MGCGHNDLELRCDDDGIASIEIKGVPYRVLSLNKDDQTLRIARLDYLKGFCSPLFLNSTQDSEVFDSVGHDQFYMTFVYGCPSPQLPSLPPSFAPYPISCSIPGIPLNGYVLADSQPQGPGECNVSVYVPVLETVLWEGLAKLQNLVQLIDPAIGEGFEVRWKLNGTACRECLESEGVCGYDPSNGTTCYCKDQTQPSKTCANSHKFPTADADAPSTQESSARSTYLSHCFIWCSLRY